MSDGTKIEWTDATWNVVNGCSVLSPGCTNCYAMRLAGTRMRHHPSRQGLTVPSKAGPVWNGTVRFNDKVLLDPLKWRRPRRIFVCAHGDLFHQNVPDAWIDRVFAIMALAPQHTFQVLTKRPERMRAYMREFSTGGRFVCDDVCRILAPVPGAPEGSYNTSLAKDQEELRAAIRRCGGTPLRPFVLPNVWLGASVEDQKRANERVPILASTPAAVRWLSCEPLLGPVNLVMRGLLSLDWVVAGGESGPGARPMHPDWARSLRDQCDAAGVPFLFKQWGEWGPDTGEGGIDGLDRVISAPARNWANGAWHNLPKLISERNIGDHDVYRLGKKHTGRLLDGVLHDGFPA